ATKESHLACTGALIAPRVVLTAGHCVLDAQSFDVSVGVEHRTTTDFRAFDFKFLSNGAVDRNTNDIALIFLDRPIVVARYPTLSRTPLPDQARVVQVGRIDHGALTDNTFAVEATVKDGSSAGFPLGYLAPRAIDPGDSGGPVFAAGTHTIVA